MAPGPSTGRLRGKVQPEAKRKRRPPNGRFQRQKTARRVPIDLSRASNLGHRVIQREDDTSVLSFEKRRQWQEFRERCRQRETALAAALKDKLRQLDVEAIPKWTALAEEADRTDSNDLRRSVFAETRRVSALFRERDDLQLRLEVAQRTRCKFDAWTQDSRDRPQGHRDPADITPEALYDRFYKETLLAQPLPSSLGTLTEELRGHYLHLRSLEPDAADFPHIEAYLERIEQLTAELRRRGVTAEDDTLYDLVTGSPYYRSQRLLQGGRIHRSPPGILTFGEHIQFRAEPYYMVPGSTLEVRWGWRPKGGQTIPFGNTVRAQPSALTLTLGQSFWEHMPPLVMHQQGIQVVADLYLNEGSRGRIIPLASDWVSLQKPPRKGLLDSVRVLVQPQRVIPGAKVSCQLSPWTPWQYKLLDGQPGFIVHWLVNGQEVVEVGYGLRYEHAFDAPGNHLVAAQIYLVDWQGVHLFHTTPETQITVSPAEDLGRKTLDLFEQQELSRLPTLRPKLQKPLQSLKKEVAKGGKRQAYWQQRLNAQQKRLDFFDREVPSPSSVQGIDQVAKAQEGARYSTPVPAVLMHPEMSGPVPLSLYLVLHHRQRDQWEAKLLDMTGGDPLRYPGSGNSSQAATAAAVRLWQTKNPYPKGGTVSFRAAGWEGADHFSTTNLEKTAKEWLDTALMVGGIALLMAPEFTGSKAAGVSLILASLARGSYAVYENLTLGVPWHDTRNVLEGLGIVGSVAGLGGGVLRSMGATASRTGVYRTGNALVIFGLGSDLSAAVVVTYQGMAMIQAIRDDPNLDDGQKASELLRITSMLVLNGVMTFVSNRDLFTSPRGSLAGRALAPDASGRLGPKTRHALELEVKRRGRGKQLKTDDGKPISDQQLFEVFCRVQADEQRLTDVQAELGSDRARREFGRLARSNRRLQPIDATSRVRLSRAFEVPVHQASELDAGSVRVSYQVERGQVSKIVVRCGAGTSVDDVLRHAPTVQLLKRYRGMTGRFRSRLDRLRRFFGQSSPTPTDKAAFEAWGELLKLPGLIAARRKQLVHRDLQAGDRARLENEIESLRRQLETYLPRVETHARGRGYIASEGASELPPHDPLLNVQAELGSGRARWELAYLADSKRRFQPINATSQESLSRALEVPVHQAKELSAGSVRVSYQAEQGQVSEIVVQFGPGTSVDDVLRHAATVQLLKRYRGMTLRFRSRLVRLRPFFAQKDPKSDKAAFEAWGELLKHPDLIEKHRTELVQRDLQADDRTRLENEIESLRRQLEKYLPQVESFAQGRGYIASDGSSELPPHHQTVEQRWQIGDKIPQEALNEPDHWVYDTKDAKWHRRQEPYLGTDWMKAPHSQSEFLQFALELEGTNLLIYLLYRPKDKDMDESSWFQEALYAGKTVEDITRIVRNADFQSLFETKDGKKIIAKRVTEVIELEKLQEIAREKTSSDGQEVSFSDMTKTSLAHPKIKDSLDKTGFHGDWEVIYKDFEQDPNRIFSEQGMVYWLNNRLGVSGFHFHISFPRPTREEDIDHLLTLITHLNNYEALRVYGQSRYEKTEPESHQKIKRPGLPVGHPHLGVIGAEDLKRLREVIRTNSWEEFEEWPFKWHFVAIRYSPYKGTGRIGIEFRKFHGGQEETNTMELIKKTIKILSQPDQPFRLGKEKGESHNQSYSLNQLQSSGLIPQKAVLEKHLPKDLVDFLKEAAEEAGDLPDGSLSLASERLLVRWSVPFVKWEDHPAIPKGAHGIIKTARRALIERLEDIKDPESTGETLIATKNTQHAIQKAISEWANATNLWRYF